MNKKMNKKQEKVTIIIDSETQKGKFADGFGIKNKGELAILDFGFHAPENKITIVNRTIVPLSLLITLGDKIESLRKELKENDQKKKKSGSKN